MQSRARFSALALLAGIACSPPEPANVYVPAPDYHQSLTIAADLAPSDSLRAGTWLTLHAHRTTGPWQLVPRGQADLTDCWWRRPPPADEVEVAGNVTWRVSPADSARFDLPTPPVMERRVRFARPGRYRLWALSHGCRTPITSDTLEVAVVP